MFGIREDVRAWADGRVVAIDIHCPGRRSEPVYLVGNSVPARRRVSLTA